MVLRFQGVDFLEIDSLLSEQERVVRNQARSFVEQSVDPIIEECNRAERFPRELVRVFGELGYLGSTMTRHGCAGMSNVEDGLVKQEFERCDGGIRSFLSVSDLVMRCIDLFGSDQQKLEWIAALGAGEKIGCFCLTEPDFGSNPSGMRSRAQRSGDQYILNGEKMWITSGSIADVAIVWAKSDEHENKIKGFLVETDRPGFSACDVQGKWSLRTVVTSRVNFKDVRIPVSNLLPGSSMRAAFTCLDHARYGISWGSIGAAMSCYDAALRYSCARKQFHNQPLASHQLVQQKLVWMISEITKAQLLILQVGRLKDRNEAQPKHISMAKRNNAWMALECARLARDLLGASGIVDDYPVVRHMLNLESVLTYEGTHDIHTLVVGSAITGINAF